MSTFHRGLLLLLPLGLVLACGSGSASAEAPKGGEKTQRQGRPKGRSGLTHTQGWELFTWRGEGDEELRFTLVIGTPVTTKRAEVLFSREPGDGRFYMRGQGHEALLTALRRLASGQEVLWNASARIPEPGGGIAVEMPADADRSEVLRLAEQRGLRLVFPD